MFFILTLISFMTGKEVREALLANGIILADLASSLGISAQTLNSRLNAKYFKSEYMDEIADILDITFDTKVDKDVNSLLKLVESQQRTIENLSETIKFLSTK